MGNWERQQEEKKEAREQEKTSRETLGKFYYDLGKIAFTALVIGSLIPIATDQQKIEYGVLTGVGIFTTCIFAYVGYQTIKKK